MVDTSPQTSLLGMIGGYAEILAKDPRSTVFVPLSEAYRKMGMLADAVEVASKGVQALGNHAPGYIALGRALAEQGAWERSAAAFERVLVLEPANLQGLKGLARVRMTQQHRDVARQLLEQVLTLAPGDEQAAKMLASLGPAATRPAVAAASAGALGSGVQPGAVSPGTIGNDAEPPIATVTLAEIYERQGLLRKAFKIYRELYQADAANRGLYDKLVTLKRQIEAGAEPLAAAIDAAAPASPATVQVVAATPAVPVAPVGPTTAEKTIVVYNRWLAAIRRRRADV